MKEIGCTQCPYAGHIYLKECPDAYTEVSSHCGLYNHEPIDQKGGAEKVKIKSTKDLINNIAGFDVSGIKPLPEYNDGITDVEQKGGAE